MCGAIAQRRACPPQEGLSEPAFYYWKRALAKRDGELACGGGGHGSCVAPDRPGGGGPGCGANGGRVSGHGALFAQVDVRAVRDEPAGGVEVVLAGERRVRVAPGFDGATLQRVVAVLEEAARC